MPNARARRTALGLVALVALAAPSLATARSPVLWGGTGANGQGPASILMSTADGRVTVRNVQLVLSCTDTESHPRFRQAWYASSDRPATLRLNRYTARLTADAGGYEGTARLSGTLGSNGRGTTRVDVDAVARNDRGAIIARCDGSVDLRLRRR